MLISVDTEREIERTLEGIIESFAQKVLGRPLTDSIEEKYPDLMAAGLYTQLEKAYIAGKVAQHGGRTLKDESLDRLIASGDLNLSSIDQNTLVLLRRDTQRFLKGKVGDWKKKVWLLVSQTNRAWEHTLANKAPVEVDRVEGWRKKALVDLVGKVEDLKGQFQASLDKLIQTEIMQYYQRAQVAGLPGSEMVYKIPSKEACPSCVEIHVDKDGVPRTYRLSEVAGNSNWDTERYAWDFTIGPTHPYCTCPLYIVSKDGMPNTW